ncbi:MAG: 3-phosphoshikimate 1-carboxyvinyltransferase [Rhizobiales bacterium]|nr:3-phosphoshikimate 1-carboxyvinyltransferase [Hyphomicrobiales bacterium]
MSESWQRQSILAHTDKSSPLRAVHSTGLTGRMCVPGDKSISHRALMLSALCIGKSTITGLLESEDVIATAKAMAALGAYVERTQDGAWHVQGVGVGGLSEPDVEIDFGNAGTGVRLCAGLVAATPINVRFTGDASLQGRPMGRIITPLEQMGAVFEAQTPGRLPLTLKGARDPVPITYELPMPSAQVKSAVLLAALNTPGTTSVIETIATRDHSERMLKAFGADIDIEMQGTTRRISITGQHELTAANVDVPGDPSSAAFALVAALICENSEITVENVMLNPTRTGLIDTLQDMGGDITISNRRLSGGEEVGDVRATSSALHGVTVPAERAPSMIDEYPVLAVAAACATGTTHMAGLQELRVKESDRLAAVANGLEVNGVAVRAGDDWLEVDGGAVPGGGLVATHLDHRIAMAFSVLGLVASAPVEIDDAAIISTSFPDFIDRMRQLGANLEDAPGRS